MILYQLELGNLVPNASPEQMDKVLKLWPSDPKLGSPFSSGEKYAITPVYKQCAAILGDFGFQVIIYNSFSLK